MVAPKIPYPAATKELAGAGGFEPPGAGTKILCLTA